MNKRPSLNPEADRLAAEARWREAKQFIATLAVITFVAFVLAHCPDWVGHVAFLAVYFGPIIWGMSKYD